MDPDFLQYFMMNLIEISNDLSDPDDQFDKKSKSCINI